MTMMLLMLVQNNYLCLVRARTCANGARFSILNILIQKSHPPNRYYQLWKRSEKREHDGAGGGAGGKKRRVDVVKVACPVCNRSMTSQKQLLLHEAGVKHKKAATLAAAAATKKCI